MFLLVRDPRTQNDWKITDALTVSNRAVRGRGGPWIPGLGVEPGVDLGLDRSSSSFFSSKKLFMVHQNSFKHKKTELLSKNTVTTCQVTH